MIVYKNILEKLKGAGYSTYMLRESNIIGQASVQAIRKNKPVNLRTIDTICQLCGCRIEDIVEIVPDKEERTPH